MGVRFLSGLRVLDLLRLLDLLSEFFDFSPRLGDLDLGGLLDLALDLLGDLDLAEDLDLDLGLLCGDGEQEGETGRVLSDFLLLLFRDLFRDFISLAILAVWALKRSDATRSSRKDFSTGG